MSGFPLRFVEAEGARRRNDEATRVAAGVERAPRAERGKLYGVRTWKKLGDSIITAGAVHNVKAAWPELRFTYVGHAPEIWKHNPDVEWGEPDEVLPRIDYGGTEEERRAVYGTVVEGFTRTLCRHLERLPKLPMATRSPYAVLSRDEQDEAARRWSGVVLLNANGQESSFSKFYPHWQEVVDALRGRYEIVQVGSRERANISPALKGVVDWRGKSENIRDYMGMVWASNGVVSPPSGIVNIAAAFCRPAVVVNGGRELPALTRYPMARHLFREHERCGWGSGRCCVALTRDGKRACTDIVKRGGFECAACMDAIGPDEIAAAVREEVG